jgi:Uma2 family endonuclease
MRPSVRKARPHDPTVYPVEEKVGEDILQRWIIELLRPQLQRWLEQRNVKAFVGADQFVYWKQYDPHKRVAPDLYVLPGVAPTTWVRSWKTWETGIAPSFSLEIVSTDWEKDYSEAPPLHEAVGVGELMIFDPAWAERPRGFRWQVFRRVGKRGLVRVEATNGDRVRSRALGAWLRAVGDGRATRIRVAIGPRGGELVPTADEAAAAERAAKEAALARVAELEAKLARVRKPGGSEGRGDRKRR